jgi:hypothetical protein
MVQSSDQHIIHQHTFAERCVFYLLHQFGAVPMLVFATIGFIIVASLIWRERVQSMIGPFAKFIDGFINRKEKGS